MDLDFPGDGLGGAGRDGRGGLEEELNFPEMNWVYCRGSLQRVNRILREVDILL